LTAMRVGFIGLGDQGAPMADAIAAAGHELHVWARRPETVQPYRGRAIVEESVTGLARVVEHVGICVGNAADVESVLHARGLLAALAPGSVVAIHSTIAPEAARRFAVAAAGHEVGLVDAPVSGGRKAAEARRLLVMVGATQELFDKARPVLTTYGDPVRLLGPVGAGQQVKVLNNLLMNANLTNAHLVLELGRHLGISRPELRELLLHGTARSFSLEALDTIVRPGRLSLATGAKDLGIARGFLAGAPGELQLLDTVIATALEVRHLMAPERDREVAE
jgi:3-hydroxyisobutyrate dehydrogenase